jgi:hypothetical protein
VQLWGTNANGRPFIEAACTLNVGKSGFQLDKVRARLKPGDIISLVYAGRKARFRVVWVGEGDTPREHHVGLLFAEPASRLWSNGTSSHAAADELAHDRRRYDRFECFLGAMVQVEGQQLPMSGHVHDLSLGGCCIVVPQSLKPGMHVVLDLLMNHGTVRIAGTVRSEHGSRGVGIEFQDISADHLQQLRRFLKWSSQTWPGAEPAPADNSRGPVFA